VSESRRTKKSPDGPRERTTPAWKRKLDDALAARKAKGDTPGNYSQLGARIGRHRTAIRKMMLADSSKLVDAICEVLPEIGRPMEEPTAPTVEPEVVEIVKRLNTEQQSDVLAYIVKKYVLKEP
jgi:fructose-bisphosphate aldolase class 1